MTDNLTNIYIYKLYIKSVSETFLGIFFLFMQTFKKKNTLKALTFFYTVFNFHLSDNFITV